jgi:hypothetical protein
MAVKKSAKAVATRFKFQYAVKFICMSDIPGTSQQSPSLPPGHYSTVANIHNPNARTAVFRMKLAVSTSTEINPPLISEFITEKLQPDQATMVNCNRIQEFKLRLIHGFEGFLVIESNLSLDVAAVYCAADKSGYITSWDIEYIRERVLGR